ncbi:soyasapogenol B glucuronide galactosyltransferase-like [Castanea sativa]|uniref:soyasapogenol B glucuronide galactosyltransferase-like n=1 Tax=Castanea sativa TaxID=21020 RepID=UPI003F651578
MEPLTQQHMLRIMNIIYVKQRELPHIPNLHTSRARFFLLLKTGRKLVLRLLLLLLLLLLENHLSAEKISMNSRADQLKVFFLPFLVSGHMIPMVDLARLFAMHGVNVTIINTPANALLFQKAIDRDANSGHQIKTHILEFPSAQVGLPEGIENFNMITSHGMSHKLYYALSLLQKPIEQLFQEMTPDCIITDMFYPWTVDSAAKLGIPRLVFHTAGYFSQCAASSIKQHAPHLCVNSNADTFLLPDLPDTIEMTTLQLPRWVRTQDGYAQLMDRIRESERQSYGAVVNSFHELESAYEEHYTSITGIKAWSVGPVSLCVNRDAADKVERGNKVAPDENEWLNWLNSKECNSVLYVSFGSLNKFSTAQLIELAHGLDASSHQFIWVVRQKDKDQDEGWLEDFEKHIKESNRGLIIRDWAPQLLILEHPAIGGLVTHCGWNSILEGVTAGLPMITWPLYAEQFYNEKFVTQVIKIGVSVGVTEWRQWDEEAREVVKREEIKKTVIFLMGSGVQAAEMKNRARELRNAARRAIQSSGSSQSNLMSMIKELKSLKCGRS